MDNNQKFNSKMLILFGLVMFYVTVKITCNPLFFRHVHFSIGLPFYNPVIKVVSSTFIYPLVYVISDLITVLSNRRTAIFIIIVGLLCDGFFSYCVYYVSTTEVPQFMTTTELKNADFVNYLGYPIWKLYYSGVIGSVITSIIEILLFNKLYKKVNNFYTSTIISIIIVLVIHNPIAALPIWNEPDFWTIVTNGLFVDISFMIIYVAIIYVIIKLYYLKYSLKQKTN